MGGAASHYFCFLRTRKTRSSVAWVKMGRIDWRFGDRGEGMSWPPKGCFAHVVGSHEEEEDGFHSWPQHIMPAFWVGRGEKKGGVPPVVSDFCFF